MTEIAIIIGAFGTVNKRLTKGLEDLDIRKQTETIQNAVLLKSARILMIVLENWGDLRPLKLQ